MNGPYPPVVPPKPPNIEVSHTIDVTSTSEYLHQDQEPQQLQSQPKQKEEEVAASNKQSEPTRQKGSGTRTSVFAESLEPLPSQIRSKLEPRDEPRGGKGRLPGEIRPEIGIISFLCEYERVRAQVVETVVETAVEPAVEPKKNIFQSLLRPSNSQRKLLSESKQKMAIDVAAKRISDRRGYTHINIDKLYENEKNKSTYQVNIVEKAGLEEVEVEEVGSRLKKSKSRGKRLGQEMVKKVRVPIESISGDGESTVVTSDQMADSIDTNLNDGQKKEDSMREVREKEQQKRDRSPAPMLPVQQDVESSLSIDFSSILKRHEATASPKKVKRGSLNTSLMTRSESRPNVRDFAGEGSSNFIRSAFRRRSKSPTKKSSMKEDLDQHSSLKQSPAKKPEKRKDRKADIPRLPPPTPVMPDGSIYRRPIYSIRDSIAQHTGLRALIPLGEPEPEKTKLSFAKDGQPQPAVSQYQQSSGNSSNARNSSTSNGHSKSPSGISAGSNEIDNLSEVSSAIISDAQSISIHKTNGGAEWGSNCNLVRKPTRPGPAPTGPLPSLPEGHDVQLPSTPRHSDSIHRLSLERSPPKSRQRTQSRYRFTPVDGSPIKESQSTARAEAVTKLESPTKKPAALVRIQTANLNDFPSPPLRSPVKSKRQAVATALTSALSASTSDSTLGNRAERTKKLKEKDLALERSKLPEAPPPPLPTIRTMPSITAPRDGDGHKDSIDYLIDSYDTSQAPDPWHRPQRPSLISAFSTSTTQETWRNSAHLSEISPIIVVAEQEPVVIPAKPKPLSVKTPSSEYANGFDDSHTVTLQNENYPSKPPPSPQAMPQDSRPISDCSISHHHQQEQIVPPSKSTHRPSTNLIANRPATPFFPAASLTRQDSLNLHRQNSHHSSQHHRSSLIESDLENRMAAVEQTNLRVERMLMAFVDASLSISSGRDSGGSVMAGGRDSGSAAGGRGGGEFGGRNGDGGYEGEGSESGLGRQGSGRSRVSDGDGRY